VGGAAPAAEVPGAAVDRVRGRTASGGGRRRTWRDNPWLAWALCLPAVVVLLAFHIGPSVFVFLISFTHWNLGTHPVWAGLDQYRAMLAAPDFWHSLRVTLLFTVGNVGGSFVAALAVALLLAAVPRGRTFYRAAYFLPTVTPVVATSLAWLWVFEPEHGLINSLLRLIHVHGPAWLQSTTWALPAVIIFTVWHELGFGVVLFLAGLTSVPRELEDAARTDGAGPWQVFRHVTWPLLTPVTFLFLILATIASLRSFTQVYTLANGGPVHATTVTTYYIYLQAFQFFHFGYGSAVSVTLFLIIAAVVALQFRVAGRRVFYGR
jgi:multiple sugar transport system permease protein